MNTEGEEQTLQQGKQQFTSMWRWEKIDRSFLSKLYFILINIFINIHLIIFFINIHLIIFLLVLPLILYLVSHISSSTSITKFV